VQLKNSLEKKGKINKDRGDFNFLRTDEIKTPRCQDNYLRFVKGEAQLTLCANMLAKWFHIFIGERLLFRSVYAFRSKGPNALEILPSVIISRRLYNAEDINNKKG